MLGFADSIPFIIAPNVQDYTKGIYQIEGLLTYADKKIGLEYKINGGYPTNNSAAGSASVVHLSEIIHHAFDLDKFREVQLSSSWFGTKMILISNSLGLFENVHGSVNEKLVLQISRKEKINARSFVSILKADLSELKLGRLSDDE